MSEKLSHPYDKPSQICSFAFLEEDSILDVKFVHLLTYWSPYNKIYPPIDANIHNEFWTHLASFSSPFQNSHQVALTSFTFIFPVGINGLAVDIVSAWLAFSHML